METKSSILTSRVLIYLLGKFHQDHHVQKLLIWKSLIQIAQSTFPEIKTFQDSMQFYSETLMRSFIDKLTIINLLQDYEFPFRLLKAFVWFSDKNVLLKYSENLISHLNRHFDRFYLKEDLRTIRLVLPLYKTILETLSSLFSEDPEKSKRTLKNSNIIRFALLRIKPFILEVDNYLSHASLEILKIACLPLSCKIKFDFK